MNSTKNNITRLAASLQFINTTYAVCAKNHGLTYTELQILNLLTELTHCTQKIICDTSFLPKQTVSNVLSKFETLNVIRIDHSRRKHKTVELTDAGREYCESILKTVRNAELYSMSQFSDEEMTALTNMLDNYASEFHKSTVAQLLEVKP